MLSFSSSKSTINRNYGSFGATNTVYVSAGATNKQIQVIIDSANSGSTIIFNGALYTDLNLIIKKSLNIISKVDCY